MEHSQTNQSVVITGMHRSGTSLTASILRSAGIEIGDRLMAATQWNSKGFFEDWDFVELHQEILKAQGIAQEGWTEQKSVEVQEQYIAIAQNLISERQNKVLWGWKDPRTTLFLDFWLKLIPQAKFIFIFRAPWEVVDSLFRRGDPIFDTNPNFALKQWSIYNSAILDFYQHNREQCFLLNIKSIIEKPDDIIKLIAEKLHLELKSPEFLFDQSSFKVGSSMSYRQAQITKLFPEVIDLYQQLLQHSDKDVYDAYSTKTNQDIESSDKFWFLQDWHDLRSLANENQELTNKLAQAKTDEFQLLESQQKLKQIESQLKQTENQLKQAEQKSSLDRAQVDQLKLLVLGMESSKFWKIRSLWFQLKNRFNRKNTDSVYQKYLSSINEETPKPH